MSTSTELSRLENPFAVIFYLVVGAGGQYEIVFEKCLFCGTLEEQMGPESNENETTLCCKGCHRLVFGGLEAYRLQEAF